MSKAYRKIPATRKPRGTGRAAGYVASAISFRLCLFRIMNAIFALYLLMQKEGRAEDNQMLRAFLIEARVTSKLIIFSYIEMVTGILNLWKT